MAIVNAQNPYQVINMRGRLVEITTEGADDHIDKMAKKYLGQEKYPFRRPGEQRLILKIVPERIAGMR